MYTVCVRDHLMIAHSFAGELFGPAQRLHGATYVVDVEFRAATLTAEGVVLDIGHAAETVHKILAELNFRNLDEVPDFARTNTTTEFLARVVFDRVANAARSGQMGDAGRRLASVRVCLHESHVAWAAYEAMLPEATEA